MTVSTQGIELKSGSRAWRASVEMLSSMRFSISLLTVICIASVIGTVLKQHEPLGNYINQFGPFWAEVFGSFSLYNVYSAWWFMVILGFLVLSTSLCIARNTPKIWVDLRSFKENIREQSLQAFGHRATAELQEPAEQAANRLGNMLTASGWKVKLQERSSSHGPAWMIAAKAGSVNKIGYIAAHSAIVLVCLGGLLDGDLMVRAQMLFNGKSAFTGGGVMADVAPEHRLSDRNPTFRGNLLVTEGTQSATAILNQPDGILLQELPFSIELKKFIVEYYSTGMPKLFASDIVIHDKETGEKINTRVEVNHPASHRGIEIYQSSFDDGGSTVKLQSIPLAGTESSFDLQGVIGGSAKIQRTTESQAQALTVEFTGLRVINVENMAGDSLSGADTRTVDLRQALQARMGAANKTQENKALRNVGPSVSYKLRDAAGQAREFNNYMLPVDMGDGAAVFLLGMRENPAQRFQYLRIPADAKDSMDEFWRLWRALQNPRLRAQAAERYASQAVDPKRPELVAALSASAGRALNLFAARPKPATAGDNASPAVAGLQAVSDFLEANVPESERAKAGEVFIRILNGTLFELAQIARGQAGLPSMPGDAHTQAFMTQAVLALSDVPLYPAPIVLQLADFTKVQASVFQVARAPGKLVVYLGCALLIFGVFSMLYVRERRLWVWLSPSPNSSHVPVTSATLALSTNRKTMDGDREFEHLKLRLLGLKD